MLTSDPWIISTGATILWIEVLLENGRALNFFGVNSLRSAGDIYYPVIVGIIVMWAIQVVGSYFFGISMGWQKLREIKKPAKISFSRSSFSCSETYAQSLSSLTVKWRMSSVSQTIFTPRVIS